MLFTTEINGAIIKKPKGSVFKWKDITSLRSNVPLMNR